MVRCRRGGASGKGKSCVNGVTLRDVRGDDLARFFAYQLDPAANQMAVFTAKDPSDQAAYMAFWRRMLRDDAVTMRIVLLGGQVVGSVLCYVDEEFAKPEVSYWIDRAHWGQGVATAALTAFLNELTERPLYARAAKDNLASIRVLHKCGFTITGESRAYANARGQEIDEVILTLREKSRGGAERLRS